jgi:geranylgeranyl diphosphate synthase type I
MNANREPPPAILQRYRPAIVDYLRQLLTRNEDAGLLAAMLRYQMGFEDSTGRPGTGPAGKLLRPALLLASCEAVGGDWERAIPAAAALELIHSFSLIHDDIQDRDELRHGRPSLWTVWGLAQAINAGDALQTLAYPTLLDLAQYDIPSEQIMRVQQMLSDATLKMIKGQAQDISFEGRLDVKLNEYLAMIAHKTGALLAAACEIGACLGEASDEIITAFSGFGERFGLAFQVRDDFLGIWGKEAGTGKSEANDLIRRKKSLPVVLALERAHGPERETLRAFYQTSGEVTSTETVAQVVEILERLGIARAAEDLMRAESARAFQALEALESPVQSRTQLKGLLDFLFASPTKGQAPAYS